MKVVTLVNGSLSSHTTALYALYYAKQLNTALNFIYIKEEDSAEDIQNNIQDIKDLADSFSLENQFLSFESLKELEEFLNKKDIAVLFCSTAKNSSIYEQSFVRKIIKMKIPIDLAVVKVVKIGHAHNIDKIIMPIRDSKLSINKFTFFMLMSLAYNAKSEIYSVDKISKFNLSNQNNINLKEKLHNVIFNLRHYIELAKSIDFKFYIKHDFAVAEDDKVQEHIAKHGYDLIIIGGHHYKNFFTSHPIDILFDKPLINTIYFIHYKELL